MILLELLKAVAKAGHQIPAAEYVENQSERELILSEMRKDHRAIHRVYSEKTKNEEDK